MAEKKPSELTEHIGFWMRSISNSVSLSFAKKLEKFDVTVAEWVILREMYDCQQDTSPSSIADLTGLTRGAISKLITRLVAKSLVKRNESTIDRRFQTIKLTNHATKLVPQLASIADQNDEEFFSKLSKNERQELLKILKKLTQQNQIKTLPID